MGTIIRMSLLGILRDRIFQGIMMAALLFLFVPSVSSLSMRQGTELSITLSLSIISFILLLLAVFLGGTSLWKDMERRYTFSVLGLPISRSAYLLGRFAGNALFLLLTTLVLGAAAFLIIAYCSHIYPSGRPVQWHLLALAIMFDAGKYILLIAMAFLFSTVSTSFFLPIFATISLYLVGCSSQEAYDYLHSSASAAQAMPAVIKHSASILYYLLPNLSAFDLKVNAIYGLATPLPGLALTGAYFTVYTACTLFLATLVFNRRELQ